MNSDIVKLLVDGLTCHRAGNTGPTGNIGPTGNTGPTGNGLNFVGPPGTVLFCDGYGGYTGSNDLFFSVPMQLRQNQRSILYNSVDKQTEGLIVNGFVRTSSIGFVGPTGGMYNLTVDSKGNLIYGPSGSTGTIVGTTGPTGPFGTGTQGTTGPTGIQGTTGPTGIQGTTGPTGIQGTTGPTGIQGSTGPTGPFGTGTQGTTGPTGIQGTTGPTGPTYVTMSAYYVLESNSQIISGLVADTMYDILYSSGHGGTVNYHTNQDNLAGPAVWTYAPTTAIRLQLDSTGNRINPPVEIWISFFAQIDTGTCNFIIGTERAGITTTHGEYTVSITTTPQYYFLTDRYGWRQNQHTTDTFTFYVKPIGYSVGTLTLTKIMVHVETPPIYMSEFPVTY